MKRVFPFVIFCSVFILSFARSSPAENTSLSVHPVRIGSFGDWPMADSADDSSPRADFEKFKNLLEIHGTISDNMALEIVESLIALDRVLPADKPIIIWISSYGGSVFGAFEIANTMKTLKHRVVTVCASKALSAAAVIFSSGTRGHRYLMKYIFVMIHQPRLGTQGYLTPTELSKFAKDYSKIARKIYELLGENAGKHWAKVESDSQFDNWMTSEEAIAYGLADKMITNLTDVLNLEEGKSAESSIITVKVKTQPGVDVKEEKNK